MLLVAGDGERLIVEVGTLVSPFELHDLDAEFALHGIDDLGFHIFFGSSGKALHRGDLDTMLDCELTNETDGVEVVRPEIMSPFGKTMGLVKHPGPYLPLGDGFDKRAIAELLGRDVEYANISETHPFHHLATLRHGEHAIESRRQLGSGLFGEIVDLILH